MKKIAVWLLGLSSLVLIACGKTTPTGGAITTPQIAETKIVHIGVLAPLSGPGASYGEDVVEVAQRFVDTFNTNNQTTQINLIIENGGCNGKDAASAAQKLIEIDQVIAIVGGVCSSETIAAGKIAQENGVMMIAPGSASSAIADIGDWLVRTNSNAEAARILRRNIQSPEYNHIAVVIEQKDYPKDMAENVIENITTASVNRFEFQPDDHDFALLAKQIAAYDNMDALLVFTQSESTSIPLMKSLDDEGLLETYKGHIFGANTLLVPVFMETMGDLAEAMQEVNVLTPIVNYDEDEYILTLKDYAAKGDGFTVLQAADAMAMIMEAVERNAETSEDIKRFIYSFDRGFPYEGYLGAYWFDEQGEAVSIDFGMYEVVNGERVVVES